MFSGALRNAFRDPRNSPEKSPESLRARDVFGSGSDPSSDPGSDPGSNPSSNPGSDPGSNPGYILSLSRQEHWLVNNVAQLPAQSKF